jgi:hypothetical protein
MKHLQFVSSVRPLTYWVASILWDMSMYLVTIKRTSLAGGVGVCAMGHLCSLVTLIFVQYEIFSNLHHPPEIK